MGRAKQKKGIFAPTVPKNWTLEAFECNYMKKSIFSLTILASILLPAGCNREEMQEKEPARVEKTVLTVGLPETRINLGASTDGKRKLYWNNGDRICVNGATSDALENLQENSASADFTFSGTLEAPYSILYPASAWVDGSHISLPSGQTFTEGSFDPSAFPLAGYSTTLEGSPSLSHLASIIHIAVKAAEGASVTLASVSFQGQDSEQVCGSFAIDYQTATLTGNSSDEACRKVTMTVNQALSDEDPLDIFLAVPSGTYAKGFRVILKDSEGHPMKKTRSASTTLTPGNLSNLPVFAFAANTSTKLELPEIEEVDLPFDDYNVTGSVVDINGNPIGGVVVSDGEQCVQTTSEGSFFMYSDLTSTKFIQISTPSGYLPPVEGGIPRFYKPLSGITPSEGIYDMGAFTLTPVANPDRFTILVTADPQPRKFNWTLDRIAYKSLDICQDLYQELYDVSRSISGRQVFGICLGDLVHEDMDLYANYASALSILEYPTYNIIGNHDNDPSAAGDEQGAATFESYFGPRNYSFNIGGIHFVVLDNLIMKDNGEGKLSAYDQGLTDRIWTWLQADMSFIPTSTTVMVCAHSPMFKQQSGNERTNTAYHAGTRSDKDNGAYGYGDLFDKYSVVHAWAGHTHSGFNYIYPSTHRHRRVQVHTLARSTGELYTNEYLANGTPRGFTIVDVDNGNITWKFHPVTRQRGAFQGENTGYCSAGAPAYDWRDWDYNSSGVAVMKNGGGALDENYQMHVYPRGAYGDDHVYANVFLWDENWGTPVWTPTGGTPVDMTRIYSPDNHNIISDVDKVYDKADTEFRTWYKAYANKSGGSLHDMPGYTTVADDKITTIFRAPATDTHGSGTVSVTDRFGNTWTRSVSW